MRPCATTPLPSRKRSGSRPVYTTGIVRAVSVTRNRTVSASLSCVTLPASTSPPMRKARSRGASWEATCEGVKKNTRFDWNALSTSDAATPRAASPPTIHNARLVLGFKVLLLFDELHGVRAAHAQQGDLRDENDRRGSVRHPKVESVAHECAPTTSPRTQWVRRSRSRMIARTRVNAVPTEYSQNENAIASIPQSIVMCIEVPRKLTLEPWCSVFHHSTEK